MKFTIVESVPRDNRGPKNKWLPLLEEFALNNEGACAVIPDVPANRASHLKNIRCKNELPVRIVTRAGEIYLERVASFEDV